MDMVIDYSVYLLLIAFVTGILLPTVHKISQDLLMSFLEKLAASLFLLGGSHCTIQNLLLIHSLCNRPENQLVNGSLFYFPPQLTQKLT